VHGCDFADGDALLVAAKEARLDPAHVLWRDRDSCGKKKISSSQAAGDKRLGLWNWISHAQTNLDPFQRTLLPDPDVTHDQDGEEN